MSSDLKQQKFKKKDKGLRNLKEMYGKLEDEGKLWVRGQASTKNKHKRV